MLKFLRQLARRALVGFIWAIPNMFSVSVEVIIRRRFGERYLTWGKVISSAVGVAITLLVIQVFYAIGRFDRQYHAPQSNTAQSFWFLVFWSAVIWHKGVMLWRKFRSDKWYSASSGDAWPVWRQLGLGELVVFRLIEPMFVCGLALVHFSIDVFIATWLGIGGTCLLIKRQLQYFADRNVILDMIDSRTRSERLREALSGDEKTHKSPDFVVTPVATVMTTKERAVLKQRYSRPSEKSTSAKTDEATE